MEESIHTLWISQEEMCGGMDEVNSKRGIKKLVVFSMDVCKMFPSMVAADVARVVREEYKSARLEVGDNELSLALAILVSREEVEGLGLGGVVGKRKRKDRTILTYHY